MEIIDAHIHCGLQHISPLQSYDVVSTMLDEASASGAICFLPLAEIYDRSSNSVHDDNWWFPSSLASPETVHT